MSYVVSSVLSRSLLQSANVQGDACRRRTSEERENELVVLKIADLYLLMLREDFFLLYFFFSMWEGQAIFTKLLSCLVIRQKFDCNNIFFGFLPNYQEDWK